MSGWEIIRELRSKQEDIAAKAKTKLAEITDETPDERAAEIESEFDTMMADYDKLGQRVQREERLAQAQKDLDRGDSRRPLGDDDEQRGAGGDIEYRAAFHEYLSCEGQIGAMSAEARSVLQGGMVTLPKEERAQTTAGAAGGYTVPDEQMMAITKAMKAHGPMYDDDICTVINTTGGNPIPMPTVDDTDKEASEHTEGNSLPDGSDPADDVVFGLEALGAFAYKTGFIKVSRELADDSREAMETLLGDLLGERCGRIANRRLTTGTGANQPQGIVVGAGSGLETETASKIVWDDILNLEHAVDPAYRSSPGCRYMLNDNSLLSMRKIKNTQGDYVWSEGSVTKGILPSFNGRPYSINQHIADIAAGSKPIVFGDFKKFYVRKVGTILIGALQGERFWPGFGIAGWIRFDGRLSDPRAIKSLTVKAGV